MRFKHFKFFDNKFDFCDHNYYQLAIAKILQKKTGIPRDFPEKIMINTD